jgi:hypothetical protein
LELSWWGAANLNVKLDELQLESTHLKKVKNKTMVEIDADTHSEHV